jgi:hypothetical protein
MAAGTISLSDLRQGKGENRAADREMVHDHDRGDIGR